jgi:putative ABC transport system permease protein
VNLRFALAMAHRESRSTRRRLLLYASSIAAGVAALVAIGSFRGAVESGVRAQSRALLGADLELSARTPFAAELRPLIESIEHTGSPAAYVTRFSSMALAQPSGRTRLVYVHALEGAYPYYGEIQTDPPGAARAFTSAPPGAGGAFTSDPQVLVERAALIQLDAAVGDTLAIGDVRFKIAGAVLRAPGGTGMREAVAPRVYIPAQYLDQTRLLRPGAMVAYSAYFKSDAEPALAELLAQNRELLLSKRVRSETATEFADEMSRDLGRLSRFLGLVGLVALLLGGVGVGSGVHVFVSEKLESAAVLRCLGARSRDVFAIYLLQAGALGVVGSGLGAALGLAVQLALPFVLRDFLPVEIGFRPDPAALAVGVGLGLWVTLLFALLPLLEIRGVAPLRALRREFEARPGGRRNLARYAVVLLTAASLAAIAIGQAPTLRVGVWFAGGLLASLVVLGLAAAVLTHVTRRFFPRRAPYWLRQGVANLFRPRNQTLAVTFALGLGVFLIASLHVAQRSLLEQLDLARGPQRPSLAIFDVQLDQQPQVAALLASSGARVLEQTPIVPARIAAARGQAVEALMADTAEERGRRWALRREYRLTYRGGTRDSEQVTAGRWWSADEPPPGGVKRVSLEEDLAKDLGLGVGDRITWDIQGVRVETQIANLRQVDWARFATNFFAVFEPGVLEQAPQSFVILAQLADADARAQLQRDLVERFPNISLIDATLVLESIDVLLGRVALAIRFMALFAIASGLLILIGSLATSRYQRARECVLLRTLGAQARTIRGILAAEYLALGALSGVVGVVLAGAASWGVMHLLFGVSPALPLGELGLICAAAALASMLVGVSYGRDAIRRTPLAGMREIADPR